MSQPYPKRIKKKLREYMQEAYELELNRELTKLLKSFKEWEQGEISSGELNDRIHEYDQGPSRELHKQYNQGDDAFNVAYAIVCGMLDREKIPGEVLEAIHGQIMFYEDLKGKDELKYPGEK